MQHVLMDADAPTSPVPSRNAASPFPPPQDGESLASWIDAVSRSRGLEIDSVLRDVRLATGGALSMAQTRLSDSVARALGRKTGVEPSALHGMTLARYAGNAVPHLPPRPWTDDVAIQQWRSAAWVSLRQARWCGKCLRENDRRWPLRWMLPWTFVCLIHRTYMATECVRCLSRISFSQHAGIPRNCESRYADKRHLSYDYQDVCGFPLSMHRPLPVTDTSILHLQERINAWLDGNPTAEDRQLILVTAVLVLLVTSGMLPRGGQDPALLCRLLSKPPFDAEHMRAPWSDPLRVAAAARTAQWVLNRSVDPVEAAQNIADLRSIDYRITQFRLDVMEWAYGSTLRPNPYLDELVRNGAVTVGDFRVR
ncbi:TniQ family protein [Actinacidiphila alni]|uniref:TniQ family protein n=1 Tax=Actinacidiphila alni TaxID=380248 RepID=UPI003456180D